MEFSDQVPSGIGPFRRFFGLGQKKQFFRIAWQGLHSDQPVIRIATAAAEHGPYSPAVDLQGPSETALTEADVRRLGQDQLGGSVIVYEPVRHLVAYAFKFDANDHYTLECNRVLGF